MAREKADDSLIYAKYSDLERLLATIDVMAATIRGFQIHMDSLEALREEQLRWQQSALLAGLLIAGIRNVSQYDSLSSAADELGSTLAIADNLETMLTGGESEVDGDH